MHSAKKTISASLGESKSLAADDKLVELHSEQSSLVIAAAVGESPRILYWGSRLLSVPDESTVETLRTRRLGDGSASAEAPITLSCEPGTGFLGQPGIDAIRNGVRCSFILTVDSVRAIDKEVQIECSDDANTIAVTYSISVDYASGVFSFSTQFHNAGDSALSINHASVVCIPLESYFEDNIHFTGRWANEFVALRKPIDQGGFVSENRRGRTSHDRFPGLVLCERTTGERSGACLGAHLAWSGNHQVRIESLSDGRRYLQIGELALPGEVQLEPDATYSSPTLYVGYSQSGLSGLSKQFHDYYRECLSDSRVAGKPRPVHYNTWEGIYFDHTPSKLLKLADEAAAIGVERFVMDDGWFLGRRSDKAGLGDWRVDPAIYPEGLTPIIEHVKSKGMEFGLWVEPEMVNIDSELYREHPDWILGGMPDTQLPFRHQFVLDMARPEVSENLFRQLDALLNDYDIAYLKWDMNRDLNDPAGENGLPSVHRQTLAVYALIDRLRGKHPQVEIESCASGGGRVDLGVLARTDRVWTSDTNDPLDRQSIQRGASLFFPLSVLGAHVGPDTCKITHRRSSMSLRVATAMFGHMGVEADLSQLTDEERTELTEGIQLYQKHRLLIHDGDFVRLDTDGLQNIVGVIARDQSQALFSVVQLATNPNNLPGVLRFPRLDLTADYSLKVIWPTPERFPREVSLGGPGWESHAPVAGDVLSKVGMQLPVLHPEMCLIYELRKAV